MSWMLCASNHFYDEGTKELEYVNRLGNFRAGHALKGACTINLRVFKCLKCVRTPKDGPSHITLPSMPYKFSTLCTFSL